MSKNAGGSCSDETPRFKLRITQEFVEGLATVYSNRLLDQMKNILLLLETTPEIGSPQVRPFLQRVYGEGIRKIPVSKFVIVYRFDGTCVDVLALVYGPTIE